MQRLAENYRKLRNTFRFLLGNLADFEPARDAVSDDAELLPLDRYMLARCRELVEEVSGVDGRGGWYGDFQFHRVYHAVNEFCIVDLSAFYLDVLKDRLYTFAPQCRERRSAQTVLWRITEALVRLVAPILTFTAEEVWQYLPAVSDRPASVHLALFPKAETLFGPLPIRNMPLAPVDAFWDEFDDLFTARDQVLKRLEVERNDKRIGKALEAKVIVGAFEDSRMLRSLREHEAGLKEFFNVSQVEVASIGTRPPSRETNEVDLTVLPADGHKCDRCWNYYPDDSPQHVRRVGNWDNVCGRCEQALTAMGLVEAAQ
jgi:isoleucyl-tRNA synthetase